MGLDAGGVLPVTSAVRSAHAATRWLALVVLLFSIACARTSIHSTAEADASRFERDRHAILAMAGEFEVSFDFRETAVLTPAYERRAPSRSAGFERVEVAADGGRRILLRHVLVTRSGHVTKHWSQEWRYEDRLLYEFRGDRVWAPRTLSSEEAAGAWTQAVSEVDESPRYESVGRWTHLGNVSAWTSGETWRPLPRREHTKRNDYDVLVAVNRQEIVPDGWVHAQDNLKLALRGGAPRGLAREVGLNTYRRDASVDFTPARDYARETASFWDAVRREWDARFDGSSAWRVRERDDEKTLIEETLTLAEESREDPASAAKRIAPLIDRYVEKARRR
jgi:hypothetical protein